VFLRSRQHATSSLRLAVPHKQRLPRRRPPSPASTPKAAKAPGQATGRIDITSKIRSFWSCHVVGDCARQRSRWSMILARPRHAATNGRLAGKVRIRCAGSRAACIAALQFGKRPAPMMPFDYVADADGTANRSTTPHRRPVDIAHPPAIRSTVLHHRCCNRRWEGSIPPASPSSIEHRKLALFQYRRPNDWPDAIGGRSRAAVLKGDPTAS